MLERRMHRALIMRAELIIHLLEKVLTSARCPFCRALFMRA